MEFVDNVAYGTSAFATSDTAPRTTGVICIGNRSDARGNYSIAIGEEAVATKPFEFVLSLRIRNADPDVFKTTLSADEYEVLKRVLHRMLLSRPSAT